MKTRRQGFLKGAAILMGAVVIVKLLGAFFKAHISKGIDSLFIFLSNL